MNMYDSKQEMYFHQRNPELQYNFKDEPFDYTFKDQNFENFKCIWDFYDKETNTYIEFKSYKLNKNPTKEICRNTWQAFTTYNKRPSLYNKLNYSWSNGGIKQTIVSRKINSDEFDFNFIVVFSDSTKLTDNKRGDKAYMNNLGLKWSYESSYFA
ncbi:hypothetical protein [uncultured Psychromonas sp.]|uniref:hypothetical protein n=1 Tax=uncultured Psychromonas sp. TaxID=173974 RepID=UPI00260A14E8|nr:hypothetical protein [uncultured Psychromonas sp.]